MQKLQKKAPKALKSPDAELKSALSPSETQGELVGEGSSGGVDLSFGKTKSVLASFHVPSAILTDLAAGGLLETQGGAAKVWRVTLWVWKACNPLKSHKTANGIFGKAWRKTA